MENQNSVCYVARITEIKEIPGADNIEQAVVGGWSCITKKGEYKPDDLVVIATTDAVIPQEISDAIGVTNYLRSGQRVRTIKLKGVYSECLIIPSYIISLKQMKIYDLKGLKAGADLMDVLKIYKYEPPVKQITLAGGRKIKYKDNPNFQVYYKFPNIKNVPGIFTEEDTVEITRKLHGTNARYGIVRKTKISLWDRVKKLFGNKWVEYEFVYGSHNVEKGSDSQGFYDTDVWREISDRYNIKEKLWNFVKWYENTSLIGSGVILYGEIYGPGIQKNYDYGLKEIEFAGFDITIGGDYCSPGVAEAVITNYIELPYVPVLAFTEWSQSVQDNFTFNNFIEGTKIPHEGIVIKDKTGDRHKVAKVINPDYLIYSEKHDVGDSH
jgi:RNA ligase (TIGR02306 family)